MSELFKDSDFDLPSFAKGSGGGPEPTIVQRAQIVAEVKAKGIVGAAHFIESIFNQIGKPLPQKRNYSQCNKYNDSVMAAAKAGNKQVITILVQAKILPDTAAMIAAGPGPLEPGDEVTPLTTEE